MHTQHTHAQTCTCTCTRNIHTHIHTHTHKHKHTHVYKHTGTHIEHACTLHALRTHLRMSTHCTLLAHVWARVHTLAYTHTHTCTHTQHAHKSLAHSSQTCMGTRLTHTLNTCAHSGTSIGTYANGHAFTSTTSHARCKQAWRAHSRPRRTQIDIHARSLVCSKTRIKAQQRLIQGCWHHLCMLGLMGGRQGLMGLQGDWSNTMRPGGTPLVLCRTHLQLATSLPWARM